MTVTTAPPRRRRLWPLLTLGAAVLVAAAAAVLIAPSDASVPRTIPPNAELNHIAATPMSRPIPPGFIGLSIEYPSLLAYSGTNPAAPNPTLIRLVRELNPSGSPVIRFGGDTTDLDLVADTGRQQEAARHPIRAYAPVVVGHASNRPGVARAPDPWHQSRGQPCHRRAGRGAADSCWASGGGSSPGSSSGNEPEVYGRLDWYTTHAGVGECSAVRSAMTSARFSSTTRQSAPHCRATYRSPVPRPARRAGRRT